MIALASAYSKNGQPRRAVQLLQAANAIDTRQEEKVNLAIGLANMAGEQLTIGAFKSAKNNLRRAIDICSKLSDEFHEAIIHEGLGLASSYRGEWKEADNELSIAEAYFSKEDDVIHSDEITVETRHLRRSAVLLQGGV